MLFLKSKTCVCAILLRFSISAGDSGVFGHSCDFGDSTESASSCESDASGECNNDVRLVNLLILLVRVILVNLIIL